MKAVRVDFPAELHEYLIALIKRYSAGGIDPEEGLPLFHLWEFVTKRAQIVELQAITPPQPITRSVSNPNDGVSPLMRGDVESAIPFDEPQHSDGS